MNPRSQKIGTRLAQARISGRGPEGGNFKDDNLMAGAGFEPASQGLADATDPDEDTLPTFCGS